MESPVPHSLSEIVEHTGFGVADVALLSGLDESTVSRLWEDPQWLDRVKGLSLQRLTAALPGVADYASTYPQLMRQAQLIEELLSSGLNVDETAIARSILVNKIPRQYISNALEAALRVIRGDTQPAAEYLARFWGQEQDRALDVLFDPRAGRGLLKQVEPLLVASTNLAPQLTRKAYSYNAILSQAHLVHHVAKATGRLITEWTSEVLDRQTAFTFRSSVMGSLINSEDRDVVERYREKVTKNPALRVMEEWSFPTWTRDAQPSSDFALPRSLLLRHTAERVLHEIANHSESYLYYLATIYIPLALERDPTFGLHLSDLRTELELRMDDCSDLTTRVACEALLKVIPK
jgi:hypothetical protein